MIGNKRIFLLQFLPLSISSAFVSLGPKIAKISNVPPFISKSDRHKSSLNVVTEGETDRNPSTAFGKPVNDSLKKINRMSVDFIKNNIFDNIFAGDDRDYARFYALETIARMPYFSYLAVLHLYETLGWWRQANYLKIHFAESWNELHHLLIMEELGGSDRWSDRFVAQHVAVGYYWVVTIMYMLNPTLAYNLNENVEEHAFLTYDKFLKENEERLKKIPAPVVAKEYYRDGDLYMFDEFQTGTCEPRRPKCDTLYDTFVNIRDDEAQHVSTMVHLQNDFELSTVHDGVCDVPAELLEGV